MKELIEFARENRLDMSVLSEEDNAVRIYERTFIMIDHDPVFSLNLELTVSGSEVENAKFYEADYVYQFGGIWYWSPRRSKIIEFNELRYIGEAVQDIDLDFTHLGVHGGYEIMSGVGAYSDWVDKAKFLGHKGLGICEMNTLAGAVSFQAECLDAGIIPVIGMTIMLADDSSGEKNQCKLYVINEVGWRNLLTVHKFINVDLADEDDVCVSAEQLSVVADGLVLVFGYGTRMTEALLRATSDFCYRFYQIDTLIYRDQAYELELLNNVRDYFTDYIGVIRPVLINDSYCLDRAHSHIKERFDASSGKFTRKKHRFEYKSLDDAFILFSELFNAGDDRVFDIFFDAVEASMLIMNTCSFRIPFGELHLPRFNASDLPSPYNLFSSNHDLFWHIIGEGVDRHLADMTDEERESSFAEIDKEFDIIDRGGFVDYFLILWDIVRWCEENGIYTGIGRGSAGGSLIAFLMGITRLNPMRYQLIFERFLNESRIKKSLPDIDVDFEGNRRDEVKRYIESKYGVDNVCSVGSYSKLRIKAALNELSGDKSRISDASIAVKQIMNRDGGFDEIFRSALKRDKLEEYVRSHVDVVNNVRIVLDQPRNESMHAAAIIIFPKEDKMGNPMEIYDWVPVKKRDGILVSEWEGVYLEKCGFLKEDILGIRQLDKFRFITNLIDEEIDIYNLPLDDEEVYEYFCKGLTEDTFHFGSEGLKEYTKKVAPRNIHDLIDTIALHRPGTMDVGTHEEYVAVRNGARPVYDFMLQPITESTNGILIYQEQIMKATQVIGGFSLSEADDIRKAMGKKKIEIIMPYKEQFVNEAIRKGCEPEAAEELWHKLEVFSGYGFNKSHAAAYAITGYISMWLKVHYPVEFWTSALQFANESNGDLSRFINEINLSGDIEIVPADINASNEEFVPDKNGRRIFWALKKIKQVGGIAVDEIINARIADGSYFSLEDFFRRVTRKKVNRKVISSLIYAGCFDGMYDIKDICLRYEIFKEYAALIDVSVDDLVPEHRRWDSMWWSLKQYKVTGYISIDYSDIVTDSQYPVSNAEDIFWMESGTRVSVCGVIIDDDRHKTNLGKAFSNIKLDSNGIILYVTLWDDVWVAAKNEICEAGVKIMTVSGVVKMSRFHGHNVVETFGSRGKLRSKWSIINYGSL